MSIDKAQSKILASVWQAMAQSGVNLSGIPAEEQSKLVNKITEQLMVTLDSLLDDIPKPTQTAPGEITPQSGTAGAGIAANGAAGTYPYLENELWEGRPFLSLVESYTITTERVKVVHGFLGKDIENYELVRIQDIDMNRGLTERLLNLGDIEIRGQDPSRPNILLRNIKDPEAVYELLRKAWLDSRQRHGLQFREYM
jgi:hypothetical protein